jgi:phage gp29-like protein
MSYVDKFGIPPVFAITDRMDTARRDELFEMLSNFRQNMFAVLQGAERIEVPRISESNPHNVFLSLIDDVCNKEISKRVLGGTATTDEKSFVGSAEVQERVANDQHEADKLLFKHLFNTKIRRRLTKISSVYKAFDTHSLVWDNQETLNINGYIDAVQKLSAAFEFDVDEVRARTGLPVTGAGQLTDPFAVPEPTPEPKPKPDSGKTQKKNLTPSSLSTLNSQLSTLNSQLSTPAYIAYRASA